MASRFNI